MQAVIIYVRIPQVPIQIRLSYEVPQRTRDTTITYGNSKDNSNLWSKGNFLAPEFTSGHLLSSSQRTPTKTAFESSKNIDWLDQLSIRIINISSPQVTSNQGLRYSEEPREIDLCTHT